MLYALFMQLIQQADEVRELFRALIQLHTKRGKVKVGQSSCCLQAMCSAKHAMAAFTGLHLLKPLDLICGAKAFVV